MRVVLGRKQPVTAARLMKPLLLLCAVFYLGINALHGERGLYALVRETRALQAYQQELADVRAERERMELRVTHLRSGSLDLDLLDEQMRRMMGFTKPGEVIVLTR